MIIPFLLGELAILPVLRHSLIRFCVEVRLYVMGQLRQ